MAGVVYEDVDAAEAVAGFTENASAIIGSREVGGNVCGGLATRAPIDFGGGRLEFGFGARGEEDRGALGHK